MFLSFSLLLLLCLFVSGSLGGKAPRGSSKGSAKAAKGATTKVAPIASANTNTNSVSSSKNEQGLLVPVLEGCTTPKAVQVTPDEKAEASELIKKHQIAMTIEEVAFLSSLFRKSTTKTYFEYGMGGSTRLACDVGGDRLRIYAVDSAIEWVRRVNSTECVQRGARQGRITVRAVNIGPVGAWGTPSGNATRHLWPRYSRAISSIKDPIDVVLVDGRFRIACALTAFLRHPEATVLLHDAERLVGPGSYLPLCEIADRVFAAGRLVQMRLKQGVTAEKLRAMIKEFESVTG